MPAFYRTKPYIQAAAKLEVQWPTERSILPTTTCLYCPLWPQGEYRYTSSQDICNYLSTDISALKASRDHFAKYTNSDRILVPLSKSNPGVWYICTLGDRLKLQRQEFPPAYMEVEGVLVKL